jgi:hypothetical protein
MSDDSLDYRRRATEASFQRSLAQFRRIRYGTEEIADYTGPIEQSLAFRSAIGSHMRKTDRELTTHPDSVHTAYVQRPGQKETPGVLLSLRSYLGGKTVETHYTYYNEEEDPSIADTFNEIKFPASTLPNRLDFAKGTRKVYDTALQDTQRAARHILTDEGCIDPESEQPTIEGTVKWPEGEEAKSVLIDFSDKALCWTFDGTRLRRLEATAA